MRAVVIISQSLVYILIISLVRFFFRVKRECSSETLENIGKGKGLIMIANHASKLDHFLILSSFSFRTFYKLLPIRFMTASNYMDNPLQKFVLILLGCFPHKIADENYSSIEKSIKFLNMNERVFIYPEGERVKRIEDSEPKRGLGFLSLRSNYPILPIRIKGTEHLTLGKIILRKVNVSIYIGHLISSNEAKSIGNDPNTIAKELMKRVYSLE